MSTFKELTQLIEINTGIPVGQQEILIGFPPKPLHLKENDECGSDETTLSSLGIQTGDSLTVRERKEVVDLASSPEARFPEVSVQGLSEDEQLARAIAASLGEDVSVADVPSQQDRISESTSREQMLHSDGKPSKLQQGNPAFEPIADGRAVARRVVADDNSCALWVM